MDRLDGVGVRAWVAAATDALTRSAGHIDALNVFPVPDADTGTNVRLTVAGGALAVEQESPDADAVQVSRAFARGCLRAARGNSGVIISQYLAGLAAGLATDVAAPPPGSVPGKGARPGAVEVAGALVRAAAESARAVAAPQEGTILTVARQVGEDASRAAEAGTPLNGLLAGALRTARSDLVLVSGRNPVLRDAGLVDAGACALIVLLDALDSTLAGTGVDALDWLPAVAAGAPSRADAASWSAGGTFEVMMLIRPSRPDREVGDRLRAALGEVGDSVAVVGADDLWHLHVHTDHPAAAIVAAAPAGSREQVVVRLVEGAAAQVAAGDDLGVVIGTSSPGTAGWFATGGAVVVVRCEEAPVDVGHLARAAADTGADRVVILPGTADVVGAAHALADPSGGGRVLPGVQVEVVDAAVGVLATAVASLAVLGACDVGLGRADQARAALSRLRTRDVNPGDGVEDVVHAVDALLVGAVSAQAVTVQHADQVQDADELLGVLADRFPDLDAVLVGPVGSGPAWRIGVD